jgi:hypothetical protein
VCKATTNHSKRRLLAFGHHRDVRVDAERVVNAERVVILPDGAEVHMAESGAIASVRGPAGLAGCTRQPDP